MTIELTLEKFKMYYVAASAALLVDFL